MEDMHTAFFRRSSFQSTLTKINIVSLTLNGLWTLLLSRGLLLPLILLSCTYSISFSSRTATETRPQSSWRNILKENKEREKLLLAWDILGIYSGKQKKSVANPTNAKTIPLNLGGADTSGLHKSLVQRQYATSSCHNFTNNMWCTGFDLLSFVLSTWDSTMWNKPDIHSARLQVEMCQLLDPLRIWGPIKQHSLWLQSNSLWSYVSSYGSKRQLQYWSQGQVLYHIKSAGHILSARLVCISQVMSYLYTAITLSSNKIIYKLCHCYYLKKPKDSFPNF